MLQLFNPLGALNSTCRKLKLVFNLFYKIILLLLIGWTDHLTLIVKAIIKTKNRFLCLALHIVPIHCFANVSLTWHWLVLILLVLSRLSSDITKWIKVFLFPLINAHIHRFPLSPLSFLLLLLLSILNCQLRQLLLKRR